MAHGLLRIGVMRVAVPIYDGRISPVFDVARHFWVMTMDDIAGLSNREVRIDSDDLMMKVKRLAELRPDVLICGAISRPAESMLIAAGLRVIPNTCGPVETVIEAFLGGRLTARAFLMPGCTGRRRRLGFRRRHRGGGRGH